MRAALDLVQVQRPNSKSTFRRFDQNYLWQTLWNFIWIQTIFPKNGIQKEFRQFAKNPIHKESVNFVWNGAFSDKNVKFGQNGQLFLAEFSATIFLLNSVDFYWCQIVWIQQRNPKPFQPLWWLLCELGYR